MNNLWQGIEGLHSLKYFLNSLITNRAFPQAVIIEGPAGCGKDFIASRFAQIMSASKVTYSIENFSASTQPFSAPWIKYVFALPRGKNEGSQDGPLQKLLPEAVGLIVEEINTKNKNPYYSLNIPEANEIKINSIRDIGRYFSLTADPNIHRTVLISKAELMNTEGTNALLKDLEEPPPHSTFILTTSNAEALLPTIRSRCWNLKASPLAIEEVSKVLSNSFDVGIEEAEAIAPLANGSLETARQLLFDDIAKLKKLTVNFLRESSIRKIDTAFRIIEKPIIKEGKDTILLFLQLVMLWLADASRSRYGMKNLFYYEFPESFAMYNTNYSSVDLAPIVSKVDSFIQQISNNNANPSIVIHSLCYLIPDILAKHVQFSETVNSL